MSTLLIGGDNPRARHIDGGLVLGTGDDDGFGIDVDDI